MGCLCPPSKISPKEEPEGNPNELGPHQFKNIKVIGRGGFGKVVLASKKGTEDFYAIKIIKKKLLTDQVQIDHAVTERLILEKAKCPFIARLHFAFQTNKNLYLVMEYLSGGELFFHLTQSRVFSEVRARFYLSEIVLALEYLHSNGIIYRDLKPENILLDQEGHVRLTDFGLSKSGLTEKQKATTFCGTPEYLAPEIIQNIPYDKAVDFWSLGALLYFMLSGTPPHYSKNKDEIFKNVLFRNIEPLLSVSEAANDLILKLLQTDPSKRLSSAEGVKKHEWFEGYDWEEIYKKGLKPPFIPKERPLSAISNLGSLSGLNKTEESIESHDLRHEVMQISGFTYRDHTSDMIGSHSKQN
jgi:serine/threonine protein kinase